MCGLRFLLIYSEGDLRLLTIIWMAFPPMVLVFEVVAQPSSGWANSVQTFVPLYLQTLLKPIYRDRSDPGREYYETLRQRMLKDSYSD